MLLYYGGFKEFNDCAIRLAKNYNEYEVTAAKGYEDVTGKRMQYRDAIQVLTVHAYNSAVKFFTPGGVHKQHLTALGLSFLEAAYFFGSRVPRRMFHRP